jgi:hypothetical protein
MLFLSPYAVITDAIQPFHWLNIFSLNKWLGKQNSGQFCFWQKTNPVPIQPHKTCLASAIQYCFSYTNCYIKTDFVIFMTDIVLSWNI